MEHTYFLSRQFFPCFVLSHRNSTRKFFHFLKKMADEKRERTFFFCVSEHSEKKVQAYKTAFWAPVKKLT